jgi:hypothetical protein
MKEKTLKDVIENENGRWNWYGESKEESQDDNCYKGWFWEHTTNKLVRWHELTGEDTHNEEEDINTTSC